MALQRGAILEDKDGGIDLYLGKVRVTVTVNGKEWTHVGYLRWYIGFYDGRCWNGDVGGIPNPSLLEYMSCSEGAVFKVATAVIRWGAFLTMVTNEPIPIAEMKFTKTPPKSTNKIRGCLDPKEFEKNVYASGINYKGHFSSRDVRIVIEYL